MTQRPNQAGLVAVYGPLLAARDIGWMCFYCYKILDPKPKYKADWKGNMRYFATPDSPTVDHIIPLSMDGPHDVDNFVLCCKRCNSRKWGRLPGQF